MSNISSLQRIALLAFALGTTGITATFAQTPSTTTPSTPPASGTTQPTPDHPSVLTADEKAQLQKARDQVLADNADLKTEGADLAKQHDALKAQGGSATDSDKQAFHTAMHDYHDKLRAAMLKVDPTLAPIFAKLDAAHASHQT